MAQQMRAQELRAALFVIILSASLIMFAGSVYMVKQITELYRSGAGAVLQARADGTQVIQLLQPVSSNLGLFHLGAVLSYVLSLIAMVLLDQRSSWWSSGVMRM